MHLTDIRNVTVLELAGLNSQIADAARKSGFDTRNHVALLDLIWSVRRVAFTHGVTKPSLQPPPKHPTFPDRYRPGVQGINSGNSRKRTREAEAETQTQTEAHGTPSTPFNLEAESEDKSFIPAAPKRQRTTFGLIVNPTATKSASGPPNPVHPSRFPNSHLKNVKARGKENIPPARTMYMPSPRSLNLPPPQESLYAPRLASLALVSTNTQPQLQLSKPHYPTEAFSQQQESLYKLCRVSQRLSDNLGTISDCQRVMKALYDADDIMRHRDVFNLLLKLRDDLQDSENGTLKAQRGINGLVAFFSRGGRNSAIGMDEID